MKNILTFGLAASTLLISSVQAQAATLIDNFDNGEVTLTVNAGATTASTSQSSIPGVYGGERDISIDLDSLVGDANVRIDLVDSNLYAHNNEFNVDSTVHIDYDGFGQVDLLTMGTEFAIDVLDYEINGFSTVGVSVTDASGNDSMQTTTINSLGTQTFDFASFSGVDLTAVSSIGLKTEGFDAEDIALDNFRIDGNIPDTPATTPEPAAVIGLFFALGCGKLSQKKKQA